MKEVNTKQASYFYLVGTFFNKGIAFITVPIFTRILTVEDYGIVTTYNSWVSIASMFISLALYMAIRLSFVDYEDKTNDFLSSILLFTIGYGIVISVVILMILQVMPVSINIFLVMLCMMQALGAAITEEISQYLMMKYRYKLRTLIMILPNFLAAVISIFLIKWVMSSDLYLGRIVPSSIIILGIGLTLSIIFIPKGRLAIKREYVSYAVKISLPLVLHGIALNILSQSDRTMITAIRNTTETGVYGLIYNFSMIATVITTAFDGVWFPFFVKEMKHGNHDEINRMSVKYIELMTIAMIGVILAGPEVVKVLATRPYWEGINIIPPIVLSNYLIFLYTLYVNVEHFYKKTVFISINTVIAAVTNIIMNYFFIDKWGYTGAAYSTLLSYFLSLALHYFYAKKLEKKVFPLSQILKPSLVLVIIVISFYAFIDIVFVRWSIALGCLFFTIYKEKELVLSIIRNRSRKNQ